MGDEVRLTTQTEVVAASYGAGEQRDIERVIEHGPFVIVLLADRVDVFRFTGHAAFDRWSPPD